MRIRILTLILSELEKVEKDLKNCEDSAEFFDFFVQIVPEGGFYRKSYAFSTSFLVEECANYIIAKERVDEDEDRESRENSESGENSDSEDEGFSSHFST